MITTLSQLVMMAESNGFRGAMRFEPAFKPSDLAVQIAAKVNRCNLATARVICATSWGAYQMMGENIYGLCGFQCSISEYLNADNIQDASFIIHNEKKGIGEITLSDVLNVATLRAQFAARYNGNAAAYGAWLLTTYEKNKA